MPHRRLAIEIPSIKDKPHWWDCDNDEDWPLPSEAITWWLNSYGRTAVAKLIKEERKKDIEWWVKIVTPLLGVIISLLGLAVALITVIKSRPSP